MHLNDLSEAICNSPPRPLVSTFCAAMHVLEKAGTFALLCQYAAATCASETAQFCKHTQAICTLQLCCSEVYSGLPAGY